MTFTTTSKTKINLSAISGVVVLLAAMAAFAATTPRSQLRGRPEIQVGHELGYFLWMDGSTLHVRWTTIEPESHAFRGQITVESGELRNLNRVNLEDSDRTTLESPTRMEWTAREHRGLDGFDLDLPGATVVRLFIDGSPAPKEILFLGSRRRNAASAGIIEIGAR